MIKGVISRLREHFDTDQVFGAAQFYYAQNDTAYAHKNCLFVIPVSQQGVEIETGGNYQINHVVQIVSCSESDCSDHRLEKTFVDASGVRDKLFFCLFDWKLDGAYGNTEFQSASLLSVDKKRVFYGFNFVFPEFLDPSCLYDDSELQQHNLELTLINGSLC